MSDPAADRSTDTVDEELEPRSRTRTYLLIGVLVVGIVIIGTALLVVLWMLVTVVWGLLSALT